MFEPQEAQDALEKAKGVISHYENSPSSAFHADPRPQHLRGIDVYGRDDLIKVVAFMLARHRQHSGDELDLINPRSFSEKINWTKLFRNFKTPETGNKILTSCFIPPSLRERLSCPEIVWRSPFARLPANHEISPGNYYLKANHGSQMFRKVTYPLPPGELFALEQVGADWLRRTYGLASGEWFYNVFQKQILLEKEIDSGFESTSWMFYVLDDEVRLIAAHQTTGQEVRSTWFDPDFRLYPQQPSRQRIRNAALSAKARSEMLFLATEIARPLGTVRVDFLVDREERVFLNEVTFTSKDGLRFLDRAGDFSFGAHWKRDFPSNSMIS